MKRRIREHSFLNSGIAITIIDERTDQKFDFKSEGGLVEFVNYLTGKKEPVGTPFTAQANMKGIGVEIAIQWTNTYSENVQCFTNNIPQVDGGTHMAGFRGGLTRAIKTFIKKEDMMKKKDIELTGEDVRELFTIREKLFASFIITRRTILTTLGVILCTIFIAPSSGHVTTINQLRSKIA